MGVETPDSPPSRDADATLADRLGAAWGGTNTNATGELDAAGVPRNCSETCAPFAAFMRERDCRFPGANRTANATGAANRTCSDNYDSPFSDLCAVSRHPRAPGLRPAAGTAR